MSVFYIVKTNGFYQLRFSSNHFCISSGTDVDTRLKVAEKYLKKYKTKEGVAKALRELECGNTVPPTVVALLTERLKNGEALFEEELNDIEKRCAEFIENNTPLKRTKRILGKVLKSAPKITPMEQKTQEIVCEVKRPKLFKRTVLI